MSRIERKFIDLKRLKVRDSGPGTIEGYRAVFSVDEGGDLIVRGAFADTIPEYLASGFTAHSHQWSFSEAVGFPLTAVEDDRGLFVKSQFHSTPDAQAIRTKAQERMDAGKKVGFSFGYSADEVDYIDSKNYELELPRYVKSSELPYNLAQAKRFSRIRLLKKVSVVEDSLVTAPMNRQAGATAVKSRPVSVKDIALLRVQRIKLRMRAVNALYGPTLDEQMAEYREHRRRMAGL